jgi:LPS-assembly protein
MAWSAGARQPICQRRSRAGATVALALAAVVAVCGWDATPASAQSHILTFPRRPPALPKPQPALPQNPATGKQPMFVQAREIQYDYAAERVAAAGDVQIYYSNATLEADKVIYDQKTKRLHAEGNIRLTEADGRITYGDIMDLSDDFRDGFVDSLRIEMPGDTRVAATRADRAEGNYTIFHSGVYTACQPCKDDPRKPPLWQVSSARIIHNEGEKMIYFESARFEFFGMPIAYLPYFSTADPTVKRKSGFLMPVFSSNESKYGFAVDVPYFIALAPNYDLTISPKITTRQGPLVQAEWRHRLINGAYSIRAAGIYQLDKDVFLRENGPPTPGYRDFRGLVQSSGKFSITQNWTWGWDGILVTDPTFKQDYGLLRSQSSQSLSDPLRLGAVTEGISQLYLTGRGERSFFDTRAVHFYGFSESDVQAQLPVIHPLLDYSNVVAQPVAGGEVSYKVNLTSLSRDQADFEPITQTAVNTGLCAPMTADPAVKIPPNCLLRGIPGTYSRVSAEVGWRRNIVDSYGQVFTPFASVQADAASMSVENQVGVANFINTGDTGVSRAMPVVGLLYRYPFIGVQPWGTQTIEPIAQVIVRPNEKQIGRLPNEDAQSLIFDDSNLFRVDKFSGYDRVEGGGRLNAGVQYTAQFTHAGFVNALFGQSYQLFGLNSFAVPDLTNTGLGSGLDTTRSDYVSRVSYQPNRIWSFSGRARLDDRDFNVRRLEFETRANVDRWTVSLLYGNYDAQPELGFLTRREGILGSASVKINANWVLMGAARYDIHAASVEQTRIGLGYVDDCFILALNYLTNYTYSGNAQADHRFLLQMSLRTLGPNAPTGSSALP